MQLTIRITPSSPIILTPPLSFRMNVSLEGQFLHYIHRHQFLDSPEWESLRPSEDGKFQVRQIRTIPNFKPTVCEFMQTVLAPMTKGSLLSLSFSP